MPEYYVVYLCIFGFARQCRSLITQNFMIMRGWVIIVTQPRMKQKDTLDWAVNIFMHIYAFCL